MTRDAGAAGCVLKVRSRRVRGHMVALLVRPVAADTPWGARRIRWLTFAE